MDVKQFKIRIFLFGHTPPASSLLKRMLEKHPQLDVLGKCAPILRHLGSLQPDDSFQEAYTLGPEKVERRDPSDAYYSKARRQASSDETYQRAFDRLRYSVTQAEQEVPHRLCS